MKSTLSWTKALVLLAVVVCVFGGTVFGQPWDGNGVEGDPYLIYDANDMQAIGADANYWDAHFKLMADIDLSAYTGTSFNMIGKYDYTREKGFEGTFDGNEHIISSLSIDAPVNSTYRGLFGYIGSTGEVKNLGLGDVNVMGGRIGGLAGRNDGEIYNCWTSGLVQSGWSKLGGLVGVNYGLLDYCHSAGEVIARADCVPDVGGLVGENAHTGTISNCHSTCYVLGTDVYVGGLVGRSSGLITRSYSTGTVICTNDCYEADLTGGLTGRNNSIIRESFSTSTVSGKYRVGGLVGENLGTIANCYSVGSVSGDEQIGGLVGRNCEIIDYCYSKASVSGNSEVGILVGDSWTGTYNSCFWDAELYPDINGIGDGSDPNAIGESTANMQTASTFTDAGWDFNTPIWKMCNGPNYPQLWWEECPEAATLLDVVSTMLDPNNLKNSNMKNALINKINAVLQMIDEGQYEGALNKLENDILAKTDGCAETGEPDKNDWIITCEGQNQVYPLIMETIEYVRSLME